MKNLKAIISSLPLLLAVCQFSPVQATNPTEQVAKSTALPVYKNVIQDISLSYEDSLLVGSIKLSNDLILRIVDYKTRDDNVMNTWRKGDVVTFTAHLADEALVLSVKRVARSHKEKVEAYAIFDVTASPDSGLKITEVNDEGKFVKLNDGSIWDFSWYNRLSTKKWKAGERVIVSGRGKTNSYEFVNLDAPLSQKVFSASGSFIVQQ
ncbi:MAG: hypothetical protein H0T62_11965 [Parachlamydiaceae bacterium]|nr:hypothetical protein [Parachlamydiaceae bacterium]